MLCRGLNTLINDDGGIGRNSKITFTANTSNIYYILAGAYGDKII
ncbi:hypothetical protein [Bathymodiolus thermophilus thioautotrophic gill symbiont]|nr:hypothetical protein [Bathymodiolus thermophilus thioautotrophic gill symbiont]